MKFNIRTNGRAVDVSAVEQALIQADPAAMIDLDRATSSLRISTYLQGNELLTLVKAVDLAVSPADLEHVPSDCCGGCSG